MSNENIAPAVVSGIAKELRKLSLSPPSGIKIHLNEEDVTDIRIDIEGPEGTPYEGGIFRVKLVLPLDFPASPPKGACAPVCKECRLVWVLRMPECGSAGPDPPCWRVLGFRLLSNQNLPPECVSSRW